jgi:protein-S-isoprenylcysteine O-methyltransferase Ste14
MKASAIEFRLRMIINTVIIVLGFWAPWIETLRIGSRISLLEWLALELSRHGLLRFSVATPVVIVIAALIAAKAAVLRVWGAAWLGPATVQHGQMQAGTVMADGPYCYVRNPLYLGLWGEVAALAFLMPVSGALFAMAAMTLFLLRLILGEEAFLTRQLGAPYQDYMRAVPRLIPRLHPALPRTGRKPQWLHAVFSELAPIGIFISIAFLSWTYNNRLMMQAILVSFGISLVVRALLPGIKAESITESSSPE